MRNTLASKRRWVISMSLRWFCKQRGLPGNDLEVGIDAILVAGIEEVERLLRRVGGVVLLARFDLEIVQRVQVVLNLLEGGERGLAIGGDGAIVLRERDIGGGAPAAVIEEGLGEGGADGEEAAGPGKPVDRRRAGEARHAESDSVG